MIEFAHDKNATKSFDERIKKGRSTGAFNLASCSLTQVPRQVYDQSPLPGLNFWDEVSIVSLNISDNSISALPSTSEGSVGQQWAEILANIESIDARNNCLSGLPELPAACLKSLILSHNRLTTLFQTSQPRLLKLHHLNCSHNSLSRLSLSCVPELRKLVASRNQLGCLVNFSAINPHLQYLDLAGNQISDLSFVQGLTGLQHLDLSSNSLTSVPITLSECSKLTHLDLHSNKITTPEHITGLPALQTLELSRNQMAALPEAIADLTGLQSLDLQDNKLRNLPSGLSRLQITRLNLSNNNLAALPPELGLMSVLKSMPVTGNPIRGMKPSLLTGPLRDLLGALCLRLPDQDEQKQTLGAFDGPQSLRMTSTGIVSLAGQQLNDLPSWVSDVAEKVVDLDLGQNSLQDADLKQSLSRLSNLTRLSLRQCQLVSWPLQEGGSPFTLRSLDLSVNHGLTLPRNALQEHATCLTFLDLTRINRPDLECLDQLSGLREFRASQCQLTSLPLQLPFLKTLTSLDLSDNQISAINPAWADFPWVHLDLRNNNISSVPAELCRMRTTLQTIFLSGNILRSIPRRVQEKGTKALLDYLEKQ